MNFKLQFIFCTIVIFLSNTMQAQSTGADRQAIRQQQEWALMDSLHLDSIQGVLYRNVQEQYERQIRNLREKFAGDRVQIRAERQNLSEKRDEQLRVILREDQWISYHRLINERRENLRQGQY